MVLVDELIAIEPQKAQSIQQSKQHPLANEVDLLSNVLQHNLGSE